MLAAGLVVADAEPHQLADAASQVGQDGEQGAIAAIDRRSPRIIAGGGVEQAAAVVGRQADGLAFTRDGRGGDELTVGGVGQAVAVGLGVGEEGAQRGELAADSAVGLAGGDEGVTPGGDVLGPDPGQVLEGGGGDAGGGEELVEVGAVGAAGLWRGGAEKPGVDGAADRLAGLAGHPPFGEGGVGSASRRAIAANSLCVSSSIIAPRLDSDNPLYPKLLPLELLGSGQFQPSRLGGFYRAARRREPGNPKSSTFIRS